MGGLGSGYELIDRKPGRRLLEVSGGMRLKLSVSWPWPPVAPHDEKKCVREKEETLE